MVFHFTNACIFGWECWRMMDMRKRKKVGMCLLRAEFWQVLLCHPINTLGFPLPFCPSQCNLRNQSKSSYFTFSKTFDILFLMLKLLYVKRKSEQTIHSLPISPPLHPNCLAWPPRSAINSSWGCVFKFTDFFFF